MLVLNVPEMSCGHCIAAIRKAVNSVDPVAEIAADLATKRVSVTTAADPREIVRAVADAGYESVPAG